MLIQPTLCNSIISFLVDSFQRETPPSGTPRERKRPTPAGSRERGVDNMIRMRLWCAAAALALCAVAPVRADEFFVGTDGDNWSYNGQLNMNIVLIIHPGDTVTWEWLGFHNVVSG